MKRRVLALLLSLCLLLSLLPISGSAATTLTYQNMFTYEIADGEVTITGYPIIWDPCPLYASTEIVIPDYIDGYPVTTIGMSAFSPVGGLQNSITSVTLPSTLKRIERYAFKDCDGLTEIIIPSSVTSLGDCSFMNCTGLKKITIGTLSDTPASTTLSRWQVFDGCSPEVLVLGNNVTNGSPGFYQTNLKEVYLSSSVVTFSTDIVPYSTGHTTIYGYLGSAAESYAEKYNIPFVALDSANATGLTLTNTVPARGAVSVTEDTLSMTFDRTLNSNPDLVSGAIYIKDYSTDKTVLTINSQNFYTLGGSVSGSTLTISHALQDLSPGKYYVLVDRYVIYAKQTESNGTLLAFSGITKKDGFTFTISERKTTDTSQTNRSISLEFATGSSSEKYETSTIQLDWTDSWFEGSTTTYNHSLAIASMALCGASYVNTNERVIVNALEELDFKNPTGYYTTPTVSDNDIVSYTFGWKVLSDSVNGKYTLVAVVIKGTSGNAEWYSNFNIGTLADHTGFQTATDKLLEQLSAYLHKYNIVNPRFLVTGHSRGAAVANLAAASITDVYGSSAVYGYTFATPTVSKNATETGYQNIFNIINAEDFVPQVPLKNWGYSRYGVDLTLPSRSFYSSSSYDTVFKNMNKLYKSMTGGTYNSYSNGTQSVNQLVKDVYALSPNTTSFYNTQRKLSSDVSGTMYNYFYVLASYLVTGSATDLASFAATATGSFSSITKFFVLNNGVSAKVFSAHSMAGYYSWLKGNTASDLFGSNNSVAVTKYKRATIACPVDVYVYDASGSLVASVIDHRVDVNTLAVGVVDEVITVDLPSDQEYTVEVVATGNGTVDYSVEDLTISGGESEVVNTVSYEDIPVTTGDRLVSQITTEDTEESADDDIYYPTKQDETAVTNPFTDVRSSNYFYQAVLWALQRNVTTGTTATTFSPEQACTRAQAVTFLWRAMGSPEPTLRYSPFSDVSKSQYYYKAVLWAYENGITTGASATEFDPNSSCTRAQIVTFLWRTEQSPISFSSVPFTDVSSGSYYYQAVAWAVAEGITTGTTATTFSPSAPCTRAQIVTFLYRDRG